jgi:hypothetical protein
MGAGSGVFFGFELVLLLSAIGNCFVPGSWTSFCWSEAGWLACAAAAAAISLAGSRCENTHSLLAIATSKQTVAFAGTATIIGLLIATH